MGIKLGLCLARYCWNVIFRSITTFHIIKVKLLIFVSIYFASLFWFSLYLSRYANILFGFPLVYVYKNRLSIHVIFDMRNKDMLSLLFSTEGTVERSGRFRELGNIDLSLMLKKSLFFLKCAKVDTVMSFFKVSSPNQLQISYNIDKICPS